MPISCPCVTTALLTKAFHHRSCQVASSKGGIYCLLKKSVSEACTFGIDICSQWWSSIQLSLQALIATVDAVDAFLLLQNMAPLSFDSSRLVDVACIAYSEVDCKYMENLRSQFAASVDEQVQASHLGRR